MATWPCCKKKVCAKDRERCIHGPTAVNTSRAGVYKMCPEYPTRKRCLCLHCKATNAAATWPCCNKKVCICG